MTRAVALSLCAAAALFVASKGLLPVEEGDLFFRLAAGRHLLDGLGLVQTNLFSFTHPDHPYPDPAWLFDLAAAALFRRGGFEAIVCTKVLIVGAAATLVFIRMKRNGVPLPLAALALAGAGSLIADRLVERPHIISLLAIAQLGLYLDDAATEADPKRPWIAGALGTVLWVNFHAGAFLAPVLFAATAVGRSQDGLAARPWLISALVSTAALFASPAGFGIIDYLRFHQGLFALHPIDEFRSPSFANDPGLLIYLALIPLACALRPRRWAQSLPVLGLAALTLSSVRFSAELVLFSLPLLLSRFTPPLRSLYRPATTSPVPSIFSNGLALLAAAGLITVAVLRAAPLFGKPLSLAPPPGRFPDQALAFLDQHNLRTRLYNDFDIGGYLIWRDYPRARVFVDPRAPAYPRSFHATLGRTDLSRAQWHQFLSDHGVQAALLVDAGVNRRVAWFDPKQWALVFRANDARIFVRRGPAHDPLIANFELPVAFEFSESHGTISTVLAAQPPGSTVAPGVWNYRAGQAALELSDSESGLEAALPFFKRALTDVADLPLDAQRLALAFVGAAHLRQRDFAEAIPLLQRAAAGAPNDIVVASNLALALEGMGRVSEAHHWWRTIAAMPETPAFSAIIVMARTRVSRLPP